MFRLLAEQFLHSRDNRGGVFQALTRVHCGYEIPPGLESGDKLSVREVGIVIRVFLRDRQAGKVMIAT